MSESKAALLRERDRWMKLAQELGAKLDRWEGHECEPAPGPSVGAESEKLPWSKVFKCEKWYGHISKIALVALEQGFGYFEWNDRLYEADTKGGEPTWRDLGTLAQMVEARPSEALVEDYQREVERRDEYLAGADARIRELKATVRDRDTTIRDLAAQLQRSETAVQSVLNALKEARRRIRTVEIKEEHAYALGLAIGVLYQMRDELRASQTGSTEP